MPRILLVDDEAQTRKGLAAMIEDTLPGFSVAGHAENGAQALQCLNCEPIDILITDIRMPVMDGLELLRTLRQWEHGPAIVVMSGYDDYAYMRTALQNGVSDYLLKPVDRLEFTQCMLRLGGLLCPPDQEPQEDVPLLIRQILKIVGDRLGEDITLQAIAGHTHYSYSYLSYLFKKEMGLPFSEYLTHRRLAQARRLLTTTRMKIYQIATSCGYPDTKYFSNVFRRAENMTPLQYRNAQGKKHK